MADPELRWEAFLDKVKMSLVIHSPRSERYVTIEFWWGITRIIRVEEGGENVLELSDYVCNCEFLLDDLLVWLKGNRHDV